MTCIRAFIIATASVLLSAAAQAQAPASAPVPAPAAAPAPAPAVSRTALPADHPLLGSWKLQIPNVACDGMLQVRANGTTRVTSAAQVVEADVDLSAKPAESGFYRLTEKITTENGQVNCIGKKIQVGQGGTNYVILDRGGDEFLMCAREDINSCVGPFVRQKGS